MALSLTRSRVLFFKLPPSDAALHERASASAGPTSR